MTRIFVSLVLLIHGFSSLSAQPPLANSVEDFSGEQGKKSWSYLYYISSKDGTGTYAPEDALPMKWSVNKNEAKDIWSGPLPWYNLDRESAKSRVLDAGYQGWAVRRWTSDRAGEITISGFVKCTAAAREGPDTGDGIGLRIFVDGEEILNKLLAPQASVDIDQQVKVKTGSKVDFAVTPGPGLNALYDGSQFRVIIEDDK